VLLKPYFYPFKAFCGLSQACRLQIGIQNFKQSGFAGYTGISPNQLAVSYSF